MRVRFEEPRKDDEARILPVINVVFLLLIFFMIAGSLSISEPFEVEAPESLSEGELESKTLRLLLDPNGQLALDGQALAEAALLERVKTRLAADPTLQIQLKADARTAANRVVLLMESLREAGVKRLHLLTQATAP